MTARLEDRFALERPAVARSLATAYYMIVFATVLLVALGLMMVVSSHAVDALAKDESPWATAWQQVAFIAAGAAIGFALSRVPNRAWLGLTWIAFAATAAFQAIVVLGAGISAGGNTNWLRVGPFTFQPAEFLKYGLAMWLANVLANKARRLDDWRALIWPALVGVVGALGLVAAGHDAGTASIVAIMALGALIIAGVPWRKIAVIGLGAGLGAATLILTSDNRRERVRVLFNPGDVEQFSEGWQVRQASYALAEGGWFGQGLGASRVKWEWLSQADTDFIFAVVGAELGLLGCLVVLILFGVLAVGLFQVVRLHPNRFCQIAVGAFTCWLLGQAIVNIGMVIQVLPVVGVPLPFVSSGGSALIACLGAIGTVLGLLRNDPTVGPSLRARRGVVARAFGVFARGGHPR
ncbi:MAG: putative lipid II flippase FtsW [Bifidobacteriaceae bacterium]|nr:putative lipid II flippase FtsW [Bifidobacteriaceae bacterium]